MARYPSVGSGYLYGPCSGPCLDQWTRRGFRPRETRSWLGCAVKLVQENFHRGEFRGGTGWLRPARRFSPGLGQEAVEEAGPLPQVGGTRGSAASMTAAAKDGPGPFLPCPGILSPRKALGANRRTAAERGSGRTPWFGRDEAARPEMMKVTPGQPVRRLPWRAYPCNGLLSAGPQNQRECSGGHRKQRNQAGVSGALPALDRPSGFFDQSLQPATAGMTRKRFAHLPSPPLTGSA